MRALLALLVVTGCVIEDEDGAFTSVHITSATAFDRVEIYWMDTDGDPAHLGAPLTPAMQRAGDPRPMYFATGSNYATMRYAAAYTIDPPRTSFDQNEWELVDTYALIAVVGYSGSTSLGGAAGRPVYVARESALHATLDLELGAATEVFGTAPTCLRVSYAAEPPTISTYYTVHPENIDCDDMPDNQDCQPTVTCTPEMPSSCDCSAGH